MRKIVLSLIVLIFLMPTGGAFSSENLDSAKKLFAEKEYKEAIRHLKKVTKEDPANTSAWLLLGSCYGKLGKDRKALKAYQKVNQINPTHEEALLAMGMSYRRLGKNSMAIEALKEVIQVNQANAEAHFYLGVSYEHENWIGEAWEQYEILKTLDKKLADKLYHIIFW